MKDQVVELLHLMLRRGLIERADRFYSKPKPGRKRLSRWPNKLKQAPKSDQVQDRIFIGSAPTSQRPADVVRSWILYSCHRIIFRSCVIFCSCSCSQPCCTRLPCEGVLFVVAMFPTQGRRTAAAAVPLASTMHSVSSCADWRSVGRTTASTCGSTTCRRRPGFMSALGRWLWSYSWSACSRSRPTRHVLKDHLRCIGGVVTR